MRKSYDEIHRVLAYCARPPDGLVHGGATTWLPAADQPAPSPASADLIARAMEGRDGPLYVVAIGAPTNVASALLIAPEILPRIVVVWLGGNASCHHIACGIVGMARMSRWSSAHNQRTRRGE